MLPQGRPELTAISGVGKKHTGNHYESNGSSHIIIGNHGTCSGSECHLTGNHLVVYGAGHTIIGNHNVISGAGHNIYSRLPGTLKISGVGHKLNGKVWKIDEPIFPVTAFENDITIVGNDISDVIFDLSDTRNSSNYVTNQLTQHKTKVKSQAIKEGKTTKVPSKHKEISQSKITKKSKGKGNVLELRSIDFIQKGKRKSITFGGLKYSVSFENNLWSLTLCSTTSFSSIITAPKHGGSLLVEKYGIYHKTDAGKSPIMLLINGMLNTYGLVSNTFG